MSPKGLLLRAGQADSALSLRREVSDMSKEEVPMETIIDDSALEALRGGLRSTAYAPDEESYDEGRQAFNLNAHQHPALVVMTAGAADVVTADGELLRVSTYEHPDLFWGLKGGSGNFGIVTSMEFDL
jgi:hypothetical protein